MLLADVAPELTASLEAALRAAGRPQLADTVGALEAEARCGCGDDFCQSVHTGRGPVARTVVAGDYLVDLEDAGQIVYVEVLFAPALGLESLPLRT